MKIINEYIAQTTTTKYLLCMAGKFLSCKGNKILTKKRYLVSWSFARSVFNKNYDKDVIYGDAFLFAAENQDIYEKLWCCSNVSHITFVHNDKKYIRQLEDVSDKNCSYIEIPERDAFEKFDNILKSIIDDVHANGQENTMVVISAGPCAKALVYELSKLGIWTIDAGHCFCKPLHIMEG